MAELIVETPTGGRVIKLEDMADSLLMVMAALGSVDARRVLDARRRAR